MSSKRAPAPPPQLPGFSYVQPLGSGGFADVYLYEQALPRRRVAVKVLLAEKMSGGAAEQFQAEANVMAMLSTHPAIVTIYQAGVSDDGRSYLVMEYCSKPNLQVRAKMASISVAEALRVGIQVAAAVETAHRAGILHRDIKPANILVTEYNRPALTDFGIATTAEASDPAAGMSIPWSPPESFADSPDFTVRSDVWALGATVYNLLAGRSPFEVPGGRNGGAELIRRIESEPVARLDRPDAPLSLHQVLERAMAKRPVDRYESAVAFARALQKVQIELSHSVTPIDILDDSPPLEDEEEDGELTRVRGIVSIDPQTAPAAGPTWERTAIAAERGLPDTTGWAPSATAAEATQLRPPTAIAPAGPVTTAADEGTIVRGPRSIPAATASPTTAAAPDSVPPVPPLPSQTDPSGAPGPRSRRGLWIALGVAAAAVLVVAAVVTASLLAPPSDEAQPTETETSEPVDPQDPVAEFIPAPQDGSGRVDGDQAVFRWINPDPQEGDTFLWQQVRLDGGAAASSNITESTVTVPLGDDTQVCIDVSVRRDTGQVSDATRICAAS
ncbi:serine/threonine protein kinase [Microbacterium sp. EYE_5]|uniref:serine/threonine-protein kinase n=1 Tax=unclassified Microbacterium TaxID=2609290 RepID=UPI002002EBBA|nr:MULTISPECIES: serine/threonine-protein kinase [unclassified Microbacterium]MCK6079748.1 serine/threonine protein kinase [Microbacterium sp. EYE_382]MCK6085019.1 serine/threonine protein kinase [Microbacterium sp. EYE_384]MCK6122755.1 serine/threonine protein kinase [Microbacterium sp. EYE_80]MCK6125782.1 serine/threonine protein kinase [Microbacterium sp. EYE_79]MCK6140703.1 serine/threonine protein kinase [Microbacterium sp. EYE_39]